MSKHEEIIEYIDGLKVGSKISVRAVATTLSVSEGTAYRAIKDAENLGIVNTIPRVGTIKIEKVEKKNIESLTFAEVVNIVDGTVLGGKSGLYKTLNKFIIGAMTINEMKNYINKNNLLIVGDREEAHRLALENRCAILITGGFKCSDDIKALANKAEVPVISCSYDTFTTATMINKAISMNLIKKDVILVEDIMKTDITYIYDNKSVKELKDLMKKTGHGSIPVLKENDKFAGVITAKDIANDLSDDLKVSDLNLNTKMDADRKMTIAYAAHIIASEGTELLPVVENKKLVGVITGKDVIKALQYIDRQPQVSEAIDDIIIRNFIFDNSNKKMKFHGKITPEMLSNTGMVSWNVLTLIMSAMGTEALKRNNKINVIVDSFSVFYVKPVQMDANITVFTNIIEASRRTSMVEIEIYNDNNDLIGKALLSANIIRR